MAHVEIQFWTFTRLVGAFLDLSIAYLFLCISTLAYLASKFLGLFGLCLPCPCNGFFGGPEKNQCLQGIIANCPSEKISSVQCSIKSKFPFDLLLASDPKLRLVKEEFYDNDDSVRDDESCSFFTARESEDVVTEYQDLSEDTDVGFGQISSPLMKEGKSDSKDGASQQRPPCGFDNDETNNDNKLEEKAVSTFKDLKCNSHRDLVVDNDMQTTIRILEQEVEEEQSARASLLLELEKERSAAASAVDEAMAMIQRLQGEKALVELESRQNHRMMEAKSAYDAEEMKILKEILLRREREKYFLEKEVEAYRQMLDNERIESYRQDTTTSQGDYLLYSREDQLVLQHGISESFDDIEDVKELNKFMKSGATTFFETEYNGGVAFGKELPIPELELTDDMDYLVVGESHMDHDKNLLTCHGGNGVGDRFNGKELFPDGNKYNLRNQLDEPLSLDKTMILEQDEQEQTDSGSSCERLPSNPTRNCNDATITPFDDSLEKNKNNSIGSSYGIETPVHDVHVIHDDVKIDAQLVGERTQVNVNLPRACDSPTIGRLKSKLERNRCSLDVMANRLPSFRGARVKPALCSDMRRNSMSQFDYERLKIDNEVECLRERLRVVQEGKLMLNFSPKGKASLPHQFSKVEVMSNKRCWRSASLHLQRTA